MGVSLGPRPACPAEAPLRVQFPLPSLCLFKLRGFQIRLGLVPAYSKFQLCCAVGLHWSLCSRLGRCLRCLCMITGLGNSLSAQLLTCSHILGGFCRAWNRTAKKPARRADCRQRLCCLQKAVSCGHRGIPERCVPGTPSGKHRPDPPLRVRFPLPSLCSIAKIPRLL